MHWDHQSEIWVKDVVEVNIGRLLLYKYKIVKNNKFEYQYHTLPPEFNGEAYYAFYDPSDEKDRMIASVTHRYGSEYYCIDLPLGFDLKGKLDYPREIYIKHIYLIPLCFINADDACAMVEQSLAILKEESDLKISSKFNKFLINFMTSELVQKEIEKAPQAGITPYTGPVGGSDSDNMYVFDIP